MSPQDQPTPMELAQRGLWVFPVDHPELSKCAGVGEKHDPRKCEEQGKRGKCPANKWGTGATRAPANIAAMFRGVLRNVGIHCGKSGLLVVDEDSEGEFQRFADDHGFTIPETYTVQTAKGKHYYLRDTENGRLGNHEGAFEDYAINIRSGNGFVVGPGSVHSAGVVYTENGVRDYAELPAWVVRAIDRPKDKPRNEQSSNEGFVLPDVIPFRKRDNTFTAYAGHLQALEVPRSEAEVLMMAAWQRCEQPPGDYYPVEDAIEKLDRFKPGRSEGYPKNGKRGQEQPDPNRHLRVTKATDIQIRATRWLWEEDYAHWIAVGSLVGLSGREGVGKSTWCARLVAHVTKGELPGDFYGTPKGAIICTTEDDWNATLKPRLIAAGADMDRVFRVDSVDADGLEGIVTLPNDLHAMEATIREHDVALVVLDPLLTFVNAKLDTHKDAETRRALEPVVRMAHDTKAAVIGLIHVNKTSEGDLMNRVMGSRAIGAVARAVLFCGTYKPVDDAELDEDGFASPAGSKRARFVFGQIKNNLQQKVPKSIEYHIEGTRVGYDDEAQKDIEGSYLALDGEIPKNVEDIILEQEKRTKATKTGASRAEVWLAAYLTGKREVTSDQVFRDAEKPI